MAFLNQQQALGSYPGDDVYTQIFPELQLQPHSPEQSVQYFEIATQEAQSALVKANGALDSVEGWQNSNPNHRFTPNGPFNFSPQEPKGSSEHPESVKRRKIVGKKSGLAAALFRLKESGRSRKRHRKDALRKTPEFQNASKAEQERMLKEADQTSSLELAAKITACNNAWNALSPEEQRAHMTRTDAKDPALQTSTVLDAAVTQIVSAGQQPVGVEADKNDITSGHKQGKPTRRVLAKPTGQRALTPLAPVALSTRSRTSRLRLPTNVTDVDDGLVRDARTKNMPFILSSDGAASRKTAKRSASEVGLPEKTRSSNRSKNASPKKKRVAPIEFEAVERASLSQAFGQASSPYGLRSCTGDIVKQPTTVIETTTASVQRAMAHVDGILGEAALPKQKCGPKSVEPLTPRRSCRPHKTPTPFEDTPASAFSNDVPLEKRAARAVKKVIELTGGRATGLVISSRPLEQVSAQDLNAKAEGDALHFMGSLQFHRWQKSQKRCQ